MPDITLSDKQNNALKDIKEWYKGGRSTKQVFRIDGYAGSGKSTLVSHAREELKAKVVMATFTGKAANVLRQKGNPSATTMHNGMYIPLEDDHGNTEFQLNKQAPFSTADLIIVDEHSMINEIMGKDAESFGKKILVMGDPGQLPPVEGQSYWGKQKPDVFLDEVHRQALDSPIIRFATMLRKKQKLPYGEWTDNEGYKTQIIPYSNDALHHLFREDTQPICGTNKNRWAFTQYIRDLRGFTGVHPQRGESVIWTKNNAKMGLFNGSFGRLTEDPKILTNGDYIFQVQMDDLPNILKHLRVTPYQFQQHFDHDIKAPPGGFSKTLHSADWSYVLTCHKAQGSEWPSTAIVDDGAIFREDMWRWRYTAATRASESMTYLQR